MHHSVQGLQSKFDDFTILISQLQTHDAHPDVILLCETFLNDNNASLFNIDGYTFTYKNIQNSARGGIGAGIITMV